MINQDELVLSKILYLDYQNRDATVTEISNCLELSYKETEDVVYNLFASGRIAKRGLGKDAIYEAIRSDKEHKRRGVYLTDSGTGRKILKKSSEFSLHYVCKEPSADDILYKFEWECGSSQKGYIIISVRNSDFKISSSSVINTDGYSSHSFGRPLGLYNDISLLQIFEEALDSIRVEHNGVYY